MSLKKVYPVRRRRKPRRAETDFCAAESSKPRGELNRNVMSSLLPTTSKAARLCLVKPDTVLKWIKKGVLPATRTVGGHYRVEEQDLLQALSRDDGGESRSEETALCSRPMRCWEYMNNSPGTECQACAVFKTHATWCFRMVGVVISRTEKTRPWHFASRAAVTTRRQSSRCFGRYAGIGTRRGTRLNGQVAYCFDSAGLASPEAVACNSERVLASSTASLPVFVSRKTRKSSP